MSSKEVRSEELLNLVTSLQTLNSSQQQTIINKFVSINININTKKLDMYNKKIKEEEEEIDM